MHKHLAHLGFITPYILLVKTKPKGNIQFFQKILQIMALHITQYINNKIIESKKYKISKKLVYDLQ